MIQPGWCINFVVLINRTAFCLGEFWWIQNSFLLSENNRQKCILPCLVISCNAPLPDGRYSAAYNAIWYKALQLQRAAPFPRYFPQNPILRTSLHSSVSIPQYHMRGSTSWVSIHSMCMYLFHMRVSTHTSYLSFLLHGQDFWKPNFTPKKQLKTPKTLKISLKKSNVCSFFTQSGKIYTWQKFFTQAPPVMPVTN